MAKPVKHISRRKCDDCEGNGCVWSEKSLDAWRREGTSGPPPHSWRDKNCTTCRSAGYLNPETGEPSWESLIPSARRDYAREKRRTR